MTIASDQHEQPLTGGASTAHVVRIGDTVRRSTGPHSPFVHALLLHLEARGFIGAPRFLGCDGSGREILSFLDGQVPHETVAWSDGQLLRLATLIRQFHDATAGSQLAGDFEVVCHNDLAPWNTVVRAGDPCAFIDFDNAAPGSRRDDFGYFLWVFLELGHGKTAAEQGRRVQLLCQAYGMHADDELMQAILARQESIRQMRLRLAGSATTEDGRTFNRDRAAQIAADMAWVQANRRALIG